MKTIAKLIGIFAILSLLSACGGGSNGASFLDSSGGSSGSGSGGSSSSGGITLSLSANLSTISAGGSTGLVATLVDSSNAAYTTPVDVSFSSTCTGNSLATITSPVTTNNGIANATYTDKGCSTTDTITATASVSGSTLTATTTIIDQAAAVGSIEFVSATPSTIAIQGAGGGLPTTSTVVFKVKNSVGGPRPNAAVTFSLSTSVGGLSVSPPTGTTDSNGLVTTVVTSGTIHTSVWVTATVTATSIKTQSGKLDVSTGVPDQNSFSISIKTLNPETWGIDGVTDDVSVYVADHFNNPAPDGTTIAFSTEGGQITPSCQTTAGHCTVTWTSSDPRPSNGRVTILASAIGEESFTDANGNGFYDFGETFTDLPEAFRDDDESNSYTSGEEYIDFNSDGSHTPKNGYFIGSLCKSNCDPSGATSLEIFKNIELVMASSDQLIFATPPDDGTDTTMSGGPITIAAGTKNIQEIDIDVMDARGQVPPAGTVVSVTTTNGTIQGDSSFTMPNTSAAGPYQVKAFLAGDGTTSSGVLTIKTTSPKGLITSRSIIVND